MHQLMPMQCSIHATFKSQFFVKTNTVRTFSCSTQECDNVTTPSYPIFSLLSVKWLLNAVKCNLTKLTHCDRCLDDCLWGLMAGLRGLPAIGAFHCLGAG